MENNQVNTTTSTAVATFDEEIKKACAILTMPYAEVNNGNLPGVTLTFGKSDEKILVELRDEKTTLCCVYNEYLQCECVFIFPDNCDLLNRSIEHTSNQHIIRFHTDKGINYLSISKPHPSR